MIIRDEVVHYYARSSSVISDAQGLFYTACSLILFQSLVVHCLVGWCSQWLVGCYWKRCFVTWLSVLKFTDTKRFFPSSSLLLLICSAFRTYLFPSFSFFITLCGSLHLFHFLLFPSMGLILIQVKKMCLSTMQAARHFVCITGVTRQFTQMYSKFSNMVVVSMVHRLASLRLTDKEAKICKVHHGLAKDTTPDTWVKKCRHWGRHNMKDSLYQVGNTSSPKACSVQEV